MHVQVVAVCEEHTAIRPILQAQAKALRQEAMPSSMISLVIPQDDGTAYSKAQLSMVLSRKALLSGSLRRSDTRSERSEFRYLRGRSAMQQICSPPDLPCHACQEWHSERHELILPA